MLITRDDKKYIKAHTGDEYQLIRKPIPNWVHQEYNTAYLTTDARYGDRAEAVILTGGSLVPKFKIEGWNKYNNSFEPEDLEDALKYLQGEEEQK